ncbi:T9SS type A sorting domain-containing protein, partial [Candidatus Latescibacterota bacterium]
VGHPKGMPYNNFPVSQGYPYIVNVTSDAVWTLAGALPDTSFSLVTTASTDINHVGVPFSMSSITTAEELAVDIPNCTVVYYWDASGQGSVGHPQGLPYNDFIVKAGYPYYVNVTAPVWWPYEIQESPPMVTAKPVMKEMEPVRPGYSIGGGIPHMAFNTFSIDNVELTHEKVLKLKAWIESRPEEILTDEGVGTGLEGEYWWVGVSNFPTNWEEGETLHVEIIDTANNLSGRTIVRLTSAGYDTGEEIVLQRITGNDLISDVPREYMLFPCYPNPFNPTTTVSYSIPKTSKVTIKIYDILGRPVRTLLNETMDTGNHEIIWDAKDDSGRNVNAGVYLTEMISSGYRKVEKVMLVK